MTNYRVYTSAIAHAHARTNVRPRNRAKHGSARWLAFDGRSHSQESGNGAPVALLRLFFVSKAQFPGIAMICSPYLLVENFFTSGAKHSALETYLPRTMRIYAKRAVLRASKLNNKCRKFYHWIYYRVFFV